MLAFVISHDVIAFDVELHQGDTVLRGHRMASGRLSVSHTMHSSGAWKGLCVPHVGGISPEHP